MGLSGWGEGRRESIAKKLGKRGRGGGVRCVNTQQRWGGEAAGRKRLQFGGKEEFWVVERRGVANRHCLRKSRQKNHYFAFIVRHSAANVS